MKENYRLESDSIGEKQVPADAYYGVQSLRGLENFPITGTHMAKEYVNAMALLKKACAVANLKAGILEKKVADAICEACDEVMAGKYDDSFIVDPLQGSAGTSYNMNMNEVVANIANVKLGGGLGDYTYVHPNDHVNNGQSTNDIVPSAGKIALLWLLKPLKANLKDVIESFEKKAAEFDDVIKMGRTQMQDAVPIRLGQEFNAYATALKRSLKRIETAEQELYSINMGGSAIGTGVNADIVYYNDVCAEVAKLSGMPFVQADDMVDGTMHIDVYANVSSSLRNFAICISKICNDLRLMSSGPKTGFAEIALPPRQNGSSIMPGKVNPVIPEIVTQCAFKIIGNDVTISFAAEGGQLELNAFEPVTFFSLFESIRIMTNALVPFKNFCVDGIKANKERCRDLLEHSAGLATALNPYIGYKAAAAIVKEAIKTGRSVKELAIEKNIMDRELLEKVLDPIEMTTPGIVGKN